MNAWTEFFHAMARYVPADSRIVGCTFRGDPNDDQPGKWRVRVIRDPRTVDQQANVYLCVSAMRRNARGELRRRKDNFAGGLCLMIDDIGAGAGAKAPMTVIDALPPSALIETSPANFQAVYLFDRLLADRDEFAALIQSFIDQQFLSNDPGMAGVNRVFRPPCGINGKAKYGGQWRVRAAQMNLRNRYSPQEIKDAFNLHVHHKTIVPRGATVDKAQNIRAFISVRSALRAAGMLKSEHANVEGWQNIRCPWTDSHTGAVDNGAAIREPAPENGWTGAFACHHGHCRDKGWRELTEWLTEQAEELLSEINHRAAQSMEEYTK